ncbi:ATP-binding cassette domain-containing protein [Ectothiorhodospiraceae bacterium 2226]|nr:ATP-binding cassette domain-containing protein [Ectothiorhodospiraceae bacterium 2226]
MSTQDTAASLVQVEQVSRYYGARAAVREVSFTMRRGEVLGFLGPNGAGKSTTMQMITGNLAPSEGRVLIDGIDIVASPRAAKAALGYLPEQPPLYRDFTVDEFLRFCARLHRVPRIEVAAAVLRAKQRCGLTEMGARLIGNLSKGYQQRVGIAQAILHAPKVVILDEPTVGLDPIQIREIRALIRDLAQEHSVILSTHILPEVQAVCDRVQIIHKGELVLSDTIAGLTQRMQALSLRVAFRRPPPRDALQALPAVADVEALEGGRFRLHHARDASPAEALVAAAVAGDWGLYELTPEHLSLEEIFVDITRAEPAADGEQAA